MVNNPLSNEEMLAIMQTFHEREECDFNSPKHINHNESYQFDFFKTIIED